jgi:hypothetical protein
LSSAVFGYDLISSMAFIEVGHVWCVPTKYCLTLTLTHTSKPHFKICIFTFAYSHRLHFLNDSLLPSLSRRERGRATEAKDIFRTYNVLLKRGKIHLFSFSAFHMRIKIIFLWEDSGRIF